MRWLKPTAGSVKLVVPELLVKVARVAQFDRLVEVWISRRWPGGPVTVQVKEPPARRCGDRRRIDETRLKGLLNAPVAGAIIGFQAHVRGRLRHRDASVPDATGEDARAGRAEGNRVGEG